MSVVQNDTPNRREICIWCERSFDDEHSVARIIPDGRGVHWECWDDALKQRRVIIIEVPA